MNYTEFSSFFDKPKADIAIFSTYDFDPLYFEQRMLRSTALIDARRILIFMDHACYFKLMKNDHSARFFNHRYLVVPTSRPKGVFHPKLNLLINQKQASVICGSNNLTQAGCTHNLELLNKINVNIQKDSVLPPTVSLVSETLSFYKSCLTLNSGPEGKIAERWLLELHEEIPWASQEMESDSKQNVPQLVHTFKTTPWDWLETSLRDKVPSKFLVLSPFWDLDLRLLEKVKEAWPDSEVQIIVQQHTSNLPASKLKNLPGEIRLFRIQGAGGRRLHAKLIAAYIDDTAICLVGSANFTSAAFKGSNVEACLGTEIKAETISALFDGELSLEPTEYDEFDPGKEREPAPNGDSLETLKLLNVYLDSRGKLHIEYSIKSDLILEKLAILIHSYGEEKPSQSISIPRKNGGKHVTKLDESDISSFREATRCYLVGFTGTQRIVSSPCWLIQEKQLTHEPSEGSKKTNTEKQIRDTGQGLTLYLSYLMEKVGVQAVIEYLNNLNIRYHADARRFGRKIPIKLRGYDPTRSDQTPNWTIGPDDRKDLEETIFEFVKKHQKRILCRHAKKGNINGLTNFLDVFLEINKLLYVYCQNGVIKKHPTAWSLILTSISIFTFGHDDYKLSNGFLSKLVDLHEGDMGILRKTIKQARVPGHLRTALLIAQIMRWENELKAEKPSAYFPTWLKKIDSSLKPLQVNEIVSNQVSVALDQYQMFGEVDKNQCLKHVN